MQYGTGRHCTVQYNKQVNGKRKVLMRSVLSNQSESNPNSQIGTGVSIAAAVGPEGGEGEVEERGEEDEEQDEEEEQEDEDDDEDVEEGMKCYQR